MKKNARKLLALLLVCLMLMTVLVACNKDSGGSDVSNGGNAGDSGGSGGGGGGSGGGGGDSGGSGGDSADLGRTLHVGIFEDNGTLDPHGVVSNGGFLHAIRCLYDGMQDFLQDGTFIPLTVESVEQISDLNYHLHLRHGVTFANGNPYNSEDLMFSMELSRANPRFAPETAQVDFDKTAIIDEYTVDLWITEYNASFWYAFSIMYQFDKESYDPDSIAHTPNGTAAYKLVEYVAGSHMIVEARDDYWGPAPAIKRIHFHILNEVSQRVNALETGLIDYAPVMISDAAYLESLGFTIEQLKMGAAWGVFFNMTEGAPLHTLAAREAVMHAIDRQALIDVVNLGLGEPVPWPAGVTVVDYENRFGNMSDPYSVGFDIDRARALAEQEGLVGQTLRMITNGGEEYNLQAELVQNMLEQIGINTTITYYDQAGYHATLEDESNFDIAFQMVAGPESRAARYFRDWPVFFRLGWYDDERDEMLGLFRDAINQINPQDYSDLFYRGLQIFHRYHPWYSFYEVTYVYAHSPDLGGGHLVRVDVGGARFRNWDWN